MAIEIRSLSKAFGGLPVFDDLSLAIEERSISIILGPSGCGKSTLLNILTGLLSADGGVVAGLAGRRTSYLFQEPRLLPWKSVEQNLDWVLRDALTDEERRRTVDRFLEMVGMSEFRGYLPRALSGGMRQRVAIARAFAYPAEVLLMDEPFQALDLPLKVSLMGAFERLWQEDRRTVLFVTHDVQEALLLGDAISVLSARPARLIRTLVNIAPHGERSLRDERMLSLEGELYALLGVAR